MLYAQFKLEFYRTPSGAEPALDYIRAQAKAHRGKIARALRYLEEVGPLTRRPQADYLGNGIYELRVNADRHQHRLFYFFHGRSIIVVTSGMLKNMRQVPQMEIERASRYRADWLERLGETK